MCWKRQHFRRFVECSQHALPVDAHTNSLLPDDLLRLGFGAACPTLPKTTILLVGECSCVLACRCRMRACVCVLDNLFALGESHGVFPLPPSSLSIYIYIYTFYIRVGEGTILTSGRPATQKKPTEGRIPRQRMAKFTSKEQHRKHVTVTN
jgi:hypothetical protein